MKSRSLSEKGLTTLELAVVLALIAIMATFTIPYLGSWLRHYRIVGAARELASNMQNAKMLAIKNNQESCVEFDTSNNRYCIKSDKGANNNWNNWSSGDDTINKIVSFSGGSYKNIVFGIQTDNPPSGGPDPSGNGNPTLPIPADYVSFNNKRCVFNPSGTQSEGYAYITNGYETYAIGCQLSTSITSSTPPIVGNIQIWLWNPGTSKWEKR